MFVSAYQLENLDSWRFGGATKSLKIDLFERCRVQNQNGQLAGCSNSPIYLRVVIQCLIHKMEIGGAFRSHGWILLCAADFRTRPRRWAHDQLMRHETASTKYYHILWW